VIDAMVRGMVESGGAALVLAVPVGICLYFRADWIMWFGVPTPDRSLIPELASLVAFFTAVAFGWLVQRQTRLLEVWQRQWPAHLGAAAATTAASLWIAGLVPSLEAAAPGPVRLAYTACYSVAIWSWVFAIVGMGMRFLSRERRGIQYLADSSYWIYLAHLPIVAAFQVLVSDWPLHWGIKFPLIVAASFALLFASYHLLVRFTFIGATLGGRRRSRGPALPTPHQDPEPEGSGSGTESRSASAVSPRRIHACTVFRTLSALAPVPGSCAQPPSRRFKTTVPPSTLADSSLERRQVRRRTRLTT
jgi:peptidoglycan/LPS O-acetylase OafA/YrhL